MSKKTEAPAGAPQKASEIKTFILDTNIPLHLSYEIPRAQCRNSIPRDRGTR